MMDCVQLLSVAILCILFSIWPTTIRGEAVLYSKEACDNYRLNFANEKSTYYRWNGSAVRNCIIEFSKRSVIRDHYICVEILSFEFLDCSANVEYYGVDFTSPVRTFNCRTRPNTPTWCCDTSKIQVKFHNNQSTNSNFFFRVFAMLNGSVRDDCAPPTTTTTTSTTTDPFNTVVLNDTPACETNRVNMVGAQLRYYKWRGLLANSCTVGFHKKPDVYSDQLTCIEILNFDIFDCSTRIRYYGLTTSGKAFKTFTCHTRIHPRWCCSVNTINIKFDVIKYTNDEFFFGVYKVPAGFVPDQCPDIQNLDDSPHLNNSNFIHENLHCKLVLLLIPVVAFVSSYLDFWNLTLDI